MQLHIPNALRRFGSRRSCNLLSVVFQCVAHLLVAPLWIISTFDGATNLMDKRIQLILRLLPFVRVRLGPDNNRPR